MQKNGNNYKQNVQIPTLDFNPLKFFASRKLDERLVGRVGWTEHGQSQQFRAVCGERLKADRKLFKLYKYCRSKINGTAF